MTLLDRLDFDWRRRLERGEKLTFVAAAKAVFFLMLIALGVLSFVASSWALALLAGLLFATLARVVLPDQKFKAWARTYYTGEAGERWHRRWEAATDWVWERVRDMWMVFAVIWSVLVGVLEWVVGVFSRR